MPSTNYLVLRRMAFVTDVYCQVCGKTKHEITHHDSTCNECRAIAADKARRVHLASLEGLTTDERLKRLEELHYDENLDHRVNIFEAEHRRIG